MIPKMENNFDQKKKYCTALKPMENIKNVETYSDVNIA